MFENFFLDIKDLYNCDETFRNFTVSMKDDFIDEEFVLYVKEKHTPFSIFNEALLIPSFQKYIWNHFDLPDTVEFPDFEFPMLQGTITKCIHNHIYENLVISDSGPPGYTAFMKALAVRYKMGVVEFEEMYAELNKEIV